MEQVSLSPKAFSVLLYLYERAGRLVTKQELLDQIWPDTFVTEGVLKRAILEIRKALADPADEPRFIQTYHRRGYRFLDDRQTPAALARTAPADNAFIGRAAERSALDAHLAEALEGRRQIVFLHGEAGLGKTTLVEQWQNSHRATVAVAAGRCLPHFGEGEAYLPIFEVLDQLNRRPGIRLVDVLRRHAPTWLLHMPSLLSAEAAAEMRGQAADPRPQRMLREMIGALEAIAADTPLAIIVEDLHWSDASTIDLLAAIARRNSPARLMIVGTFRPAEAATTCPALLEMQDELGLHELCRVLPLSPLSALETAAFLAPHCDAHEALADLTMEIYERANGNPLFIAALVEEWKRSGADAAGVTRLLPTKLRRMFERQAAHLTDAERRLVHAAAATGGAFTVQSVAGILGWDTDQAELVCESLAGRQVFLQPLAGQADGYRFVHPMCRESLSRRVRPMAPVLPFVPARTAA